jgi:hypothetical protein
VAIAVVVVVVVVVVVMVVHTGVQVCTVISLHAHCATN